MTPDEFTEQLKSSLGANLASVILYGSTVSGDQTKSYSRVNLCVILKEDGVPALRAALPAFREWAKAGHPWPTVFTVHRFERASDVFPIEFADIKRSRRVLFGSDPFAIVTIEAAAMRTQLEHELRVKLLRLREIYFETGGDPKGLRDALAKTLSALTAMMRTILRLMNKSVDGLSSPQVWAALAERAPIDAEAFSTVWQWRQKDRAADKADPEAVFTRVLHNLETMIDFVDDTLVNSAVGGGTLS